jgi:glycine/D-amino acid oxidase-like deaminating enzyme
MMRAAEAQGAQLRRGRVSVITKREGRATGVEVNGAVIEGDAIVIAMGPWSILAASWLPLPPVFGLKGHSLVVSKLPVPLDTNGRLAACELPHAKRFKSAGAPLVWR